MIELGDLVRDVVSGFEGIAVSKHIFLTGCNRWGVQQIQKVKKGKPSVKHESVPFDEPQLVVIAKKKVQIPFDNRLPETEPEHRRKGGPISLFPEKSIETR